MSISFHDDPGGNEQAETQQAAQWRPRRANYSDEEKRAALAVVYLRRDCESAASALGIPARTLRAWRSGRGIHPAIYHTFGLLFEAASWRGKVLPSDDAVGATNG